MLCGNDCLQSSPMAILNLNSRRTSCSICVLLLWQVKFVFCDIWGNYICRCSMTTSSTTASIRTHGILRLLLLMIWFMDWLYNLLLLLLVPVDCIYDILYAAECKLSLRTRYKLKVRRQKKTFIKIPASLVCSSTTEIITINLIRLSLQQSNRKCWLLLMSSWRLGPLKGKF